MLIDSLGLIMGNRPQKEAVRHGEERANVSAVISGVKDDESGDIHPDEDGVLFVSRTVENSGKASTKINGRSVSASLQKNEMSKYISILGQNDSLGLLSPETHIVYLDGYGDNGELLEDYRKVYADLSEIRRRLSELEKDEREKIRLSELYKMQLDDINSVNPQEGEDVKLEARLEKLKDAEKILKHAGYIVRLLYRSEKGVPAAELTKRAISSIEAISEYFPEAEKYIGMLTDIGYKLEEIGLVADDLAGEENSNPDAEMDKIQSRLDKLTKLERKYGSTVGEVLAYRDDIEKKYRDIQNSGEIIGKLSRRYAELEREAAAVAEKLTEARKKAAEKLEKQIVGELEYLDMPKVRFRVDIRKSIGDDGRTEFLPDGADCIEFLFSANSGEQLMPLSKVASGGELARVMLALKTVNVSSGVSETLIFDEIDTGVSGKTSHKIGIRLHRLSEQNQVICVTHSAQIASEGDAHFYISKKEKDGRTETTVTLLDRKGREDELSRIMGGVNITEKIRLSAAEMLDNAESAHRKGN